MKTGKATLLFRQIFFVVLVLGLIAGLSACGGGGGGGEGVVIEEPPPPQDSGGPPPQGGSSQTFTISGTIEAAAGTMVDSDLNDPNAPYASNNDFDYAQTLSNPVTLGGYTHIDTDRSDFYRVNLAANQTITLIIADYPANDLDLFLYDDSRTEIASSEDTTITESITIAQAGTYYIKVYAYRGFSNYTLLIGQDSSSPANGYELKVSDDFVPGDVIVKFKEKLFPASRVIGFAERAAIVGLIPKSGDQGRPMLMNIGDAQQRIQTFQTLGIRTDAHMNGTVNPEIVTKMDTIKIITALRKRPDVLYAEPNYIRHALAVSDDPFYTAQWHYPLINLPLAWNVVTGSNQIIVGVIDTGVLLNHPDLQNQFVAGYDFIKDPVSARDGDGVDNNPDDPGDGNKPDGSSSFHGTHVSGTIAAATNNGKGVAGVGWKSNVKIMPLRVLGKGGGTSYNIMQSVLYSAGLGNDSGTTPPKKADIVNLSLGGGPFSQLEQDVFTQARAQGVIVVAAAGNRGDNIPQYPASYNGVISVSAVTIGKTRAYYSNFGPNIDVAAPGGDMRYDTNGDGNPDGVLSTLGDDSQSSLQFNYGFYQGTSMASPHVAGVVALMKSVNPNLSPSAVDALLQSGQITQDIGASGRDDQYGYGLIDAYKAVIAAGSTPDSPRLVVNPASVNFGSALTSATISVTNGGSGSIIVNPPGSNVGWLDVSESSVNSNKEGTYVVTVNRNGLSDGTYTGKVTFISTANTVEVPVIMQVSSSGRNTDAGYHYVLLVDTETLDTIDSFEARANNGVYSYNFPNPKIGSGSFYVVAGTDMNNDGVICDPGEACGAYLTLDQPIPFTLNNTLENVNFPTGFSPTYSAQSFLNAVGMQNKKISGFKNLRREKRADSNAE